MEGCLSFLFVFPKGERTGERHAADLGTREIHRELHVAPRVPGNSGKETTGIAQRIHPELFLHAAQAVPVKEPAMAFGSDGE